MHGCVVEMDREKQRNGRMTIRTLYSPAHCYIVTIDILWISHALKLMPCGREEGRPQSLAATGGQIACTFAAFN